MSDTHYAERVLVTVTATHGDKTITMTQEYSEQFDSGHYKYVILNTGGDIVSVYQTMAGAPKGKLIESDAVDVIKRFEEEQARFG